MVTQLFQRDAAAGVTARVPSGDRDNSAGEGIKAEFAVLSLTTRTD